MTRDQMETTLTLKGWVPARYGKAWVGVYSEGKGLLYIRTDYLSAGSRPPDWAPGWTVTDIAGGGSDILDVTWEKIPYAILVKLSKSIERSGV